MSSTNNKAGQRPELDLPTTFSVNINTKCKWNQCTSFRDKTCRKKKV